MEAVAPDGCCCGDDACDDVAGQAAAAAARGAAGPSAWMGLSGVLLVLGMALERLAPAAGGQLGAPRLDGALYLLSALAGAAYPARSAWRSLRRGRLDMNVLMVIAILGAFALGARAEGATVAFLFALGEVLEAQALARSRRSIGALLNLTPPVALVREGEALAERPVAALIPGDLTVVRPGERIPADGVVEAGASSVNQAPVTGESMPADKGPGDAVYAGTINGFGSLEVRVTRAAGDALVARIARQVELARSRRSPAERLVDAFARRYTPAVVLLAALVATLPPLVTGQPWSPWIYRALALLVVACPCALVLSTPVAVVSALSQAARQGVLIKGGAVLEALGRVRALAFDKTGTLTSGRPQVTDILAGPREDAARVLALAAAVECYSEHPLAAAICRRAREAGVTPPSARGFEARPGLGARAHVDGEEWRVGSPAFVAGPEGAGRTATAAHAELTAAVARLAADGKTVVLVGDGRGPVGALAVSDPERPGGREAILALRRAGVSQIHLLTGDNEGTARRLATDLALDGYRSACLPEDKARAVSDLEARVGPVAMVGDGINDAPALAAATVGVAMGGAGAEAALETADMVLVADDLSRLPFALSLARQTRRVIRQNVALSLALKLGAAALVFPGWLTLWMAVVADTGATLLVILNGLRLLRTRPGDGTMLGRGGGHGSIEG